LISKFITLANTANLAAAGFDTDTVRATGQDIRAY
jgi:hypothetical protein